MENKEVKNKEEELKTIKVKYKKLKLIILLIIIIIVIGFIFNLLYTSIITQKIFKVNTSIDIGDNYKVTYVYDGKVNRIVYYKDNKVKTVHFSGDVQNMMDALVERSAIRHWGMTEIRQEKSSLDDIFASLSKK